MIHTELDKPPDKDFKCLLCGKTMRVTHHWIAHVRHWWHASVHNECLDTWQRKQTNAKQTSSDREIPERFQAFDSKLFNNPGALAAAQAFEPDSKLKTLILVGVPARGKSRLMWAVVRGFFDILELNTGAKRWVDYFLFADLVSELDKTKLNQLKVSKHAFLDDVGCVESYGKERASLQQVIRARIQKNQDWTFLTIDSLRFDDGLEGFAKGRAVTIYLDK